MFRAVADVLRSIGGAIATVDTEEFDAPSGASTEVNETGGGPTAAAGSRDTHETSTCMRCDRLTLRQLVFRTTPRAD